MARVSLPKVLDITILLLRPLDELLLNPRSIVLQKLLDGMFRVLMLFWSLQALDCSKVALAGFLEWRNG